MPYSLIHINSYYFTNSVHQALVAELDKLGLNQQVYVPVSQMMQDIGFLSHQSSLIQAKCFHRMDRYLWPLKMYRIWKDFKHRNLVKKDSLVHAHSLIVNGLIAFLAYKKWGIRYVVTIRHTDFNVFINRIPFFRFIGKVILKNASSILIPSFSYKEIHLSRSFDPVRYADIHKKVRVTPNGIHDFWITNRQKKKNRNDIPTLLFAGTINGNKNLSGLIKACRLLNDAGWPFRLEVIGDGPDFGRLSGNKYPFPVSFRGQVNKQEEMLAYYRSADLLIVPSFHETFGLVYPEAMSQGLPVLYSRHQGFDGFFPDGHVGYAVNPKDPNDIANKIQAVFEHYELLSEHASEAAAQFSWDKVALNFLKIYESVDKEKQLIK